MGAPEAAKTLAHPAERATMNRFEALHTLGLEENATDDDVRLAYYGLEKAATAFDFSDSDQIAHRVSGMLDRAKESRTFLLNARNQTVARKVQSYSAKQRGKVAVTPVEEQTARLHGLEKLRALLISFLYNERSRRRTSIFVLIGCIVVSFVILRYLRGMPRVAVFAVLGAVAIAGTTVFTAALLQVRKARAHVASIDGKIAELRTALGLDPVAEEEGQCRDGDDPDGPTRSADAPSRPASPQSGPGNTTTDR